MGGSALYAAGANVPIALAPSSFNYNTVITGGTPGSSATITGGTPGAVDTENGISFWASSYNTSHALPAAGTNFTSSANSSTQFQFQPYTANNTLLINADQAFAGSSSPPFFAAPYSQAGTLTLATAAPYTSLAVLYTAAGQNYDGTIPAIGYTLNFSDGTSYNNSGAATFTAYSWAQSASTATSAYRAWVNPNSNYGNTSGTSWYLHEADIAVPTADLSKSLTSISFYDSGSGSYSNSASWPDDPNSLAIYGLSGYQTPQTLTYTGAVSGSWNYTTANFAAGGVPTLYTDGKNVIFDDTATGTRNITIPGTVTPLSVTFNNNTSNYTVAGQAIAGTGTLTLTGTGSVTLSNSNTYTGATLINAGSLILAPGGSIASTAINISSGALLVLHGSNSLASTAVVTDSGNFNLSGATTTIAALNGSGNLYIDPASTLTLGGGTLSGSLTLASGGTLVSTGSLLLAGSNAYNGSVNISSGTLQLSSTGSTIGANGSFSVSSAGTLDLLVGGGGQLQASDVSGILAKTTLKSGSVLAFDTTGGNFTLAGSLPSGAYGLLKNGVNTLTLSNTNTYSGTTNVSAGTLQLGASNATSPNSPLLLGSAGTFDLNGFAGTVASLSGNGLLTNSTGSPATLTLKTAGSSTFTGPITDGSGQTSIVFSGSGTQILTGSSTYSGGTTISKGRLGAYSSTALGSGTVQLNGGVLSLGGSAGVPTNVVLNGSATAGSGAVTLTSGVTSQSSSVFLNNQVSVSDTTGFTATFTYKSLPGSDGASADGAAFVLQNDPRGTAALGSNGGTLGYGGGTGVAIAPSAAVFFNIYSPGGGQTNFDTNGSTNIGSNLSLPGIETTTGSGFNNSNSTLTGGGVELASGDPIQVSLSYNGPSQTLTEQLVDTVTGGTFVTTYSTDLASVLGGSSGGTQLAYVGFTGATGGETSTQTVSNFSFQTGTMSAGFAGLAAYSNNVVALTGTKSGIELVSSSGYTPVQIGTLAIQSNASVVVTSVNPAGTAYQTLITTGLSIAGTTGAWTGKLDLTGNSLIVHGGDLPTMTNQVAQGYANGTWQGSGGITSSTAAANSTHLTALGVIKNDNGYGTPLYGSGGTIATTFGGAAPVDGDILVKYTYYGDANLDGVVDGSDYSIIDNSYAMEQTGSGAITGWGNGDFNYDGVVDGSDYTLIDNAFNSQGVAMTASIASAVAPGGGTSAVPEPTSIFLLSAGAAGVLGRRRRESSVRLPAFGGPSAWVDRRIFLDLFRASGSGD